VSLTFTPSAGTLTLTISGSIDLAQLEVGSTASSPIETFGSTVTRAFDVPELLTSAFPYGSGAVGTVVVKFRQFDVSNRALMQIGSGNDRLLIFAQTSTTRNLIFNGGSAVVANLDHGAITPGVPSRIVTAWQSGSLASSLNGGSVITSSNSFSPFGVGNKLFIGSGEGNFLEGYMEEFLFVPRRAVNANIPGFGA
jgi:hypothetical protein